MSSPSFAGRFLRRRDEPAAGVAAIGHLPRSCRESGARPIPGSAVGFTILRDLVVARRDARRARAVGQPVDFGDRARQRLQARRRRARRLRSRSARARGACAIASGPNSEARRISSSRCSRGGRSPGCGDFVVAARAASACARRCARRPGRRRGTARGRPMRGWSRRRKPCDAGRDRRRTSRLRPAAAPASAIGVQSSSCRATHSTWSGVKLPESRRISSSVFRYSCSNETPGLRERAGAVHELFALPAAHAREFVELVEFAPLRGNPVAVAEQPELAVEALVVRRGGRAPTAAIARQRLLSARG